MGRGGDDHAGCGARHELGRGGAARIHTGQAIGVLAGATGPGAQAAGKGITLIAGKGDIEVQAQADKMQIAAKLDVTVQSANAHIDWAAAKRIVMSVAGGASITLEGGNITVMCPGTMTVKAGVKSFVGPETASYPLPIWTRADFNLPCAQAAADRAKAFIRLR